MMEFGWRLGLYEQHETIQAEFMERLQNGLTERDDLASVAFWPDIGDGDYTPTTGASQIRDPRVRLTHRCITYSLTGRHSSHHRVTTSDLFFLYSIYTPGIYLNIPYWVAIMLTHGAGTKSSDSIYGGMFVTRLARSYGILRPEILGYLSSTGCRIVKSKSLAQMGVVEELHRNHWIWANPNPEGDDDEGQEQPQQPPEQQQGDTM